MDRFGVCLFKMSYFLFSTVWGVLLFRNESFTPPQMLGPADGSMRVRACLKQPFFLPCSSSSLLSFVAVGRISLE